MRFHDLYYVSYSCNKGFIYFKFAVLHIYEVFHLKRSFGELIEVCFLS